MWSAFGQSGGRILAERLLHLRKPGDYGENLAYDAMAHIGVFDRAKMIAVVTTVARISFALIASLHYCCDPGGPFAVRGFNEAAERTAVLNAGGSGKS